MCYNGVRVVQKCASGLEFDIIAGNCKDKEVANCNPCIANPDGKLYFILDEERCDKYVMCVGTHKFDLQCQNDLHFNPDINACDIEENANCPHSTTTAHPTPPTQTTERPTPPTNPGQVEAECELDKNYDKIASLVKCDKYIVCACGHKNIEQCAPGLIYDVKNKRCAARGNGAVCLTDNPVRCPSDVIVDVSHPIDKRFYYLCLNGLPILRACPAGSEFSATTNQCELNCVENGFFKVNGTQSSALIQLSHNIGSEEEDENDD